MLPKPKKLYVLIALALLGYGGISMFPATRTLTVVTPLVQPLPPSPDRIVASIEAKPVSMRQSMSRDQARSESASKIFSDSSTTLGSRFVLLSRLSAEGDSDAKHLAFQIEQDCSLYSKLSAAKFSAEVWKPEMGNALTRLQTKCFNVLGTSEFEALAASTNDEPRDAFDLDVRDNIRRAFADGGQDDAIDTALDSYQHRPDPTTANLIATSLSELDITNFDRDFLMGGLSSQVPDYRRSILETALNLLSCDYGVACGPESDIIASICVNGSVCSSGYSLEQVYERELLSGEDMKNVRSLLDVLRRRGYATK